jgi:hypothetical protein
MNGQLWDAHKENLRLRAEVRQLKGAVQKQRARAEHWKSRALCSRRVEHVWTVRVKPHALEEAC